MTNNKHQSITVLNIEDTNAVNEKGREAITKYLTDKVKELAELGYDDFEIKIRLSKNNKRKFIGSCSYKRK